MYVIQQCVSLVWLVVPGILLRLLGQTQTPGDQALGLRCILGGSEWSSSGSVSLMAQDGSCGEQPLP